ncbi:hypothetical protein D3C87_2038160 [compost metagenome]
MNFTMPKSGGGDSDWQLELDTNDPARQGDHVAAGQNMPLVPRSLALFRRA